MLINRWGFTKGSSLLMPEDPVQDWNYDSHDRLMLNTGFIFAQATPLALDILREWSSCYRDGPPECQKFGLKWGHEQTAFSEWYRDRMVEKQDLIIAPCHEANGGGMNPPNACNGTFVQHLWWGKDHVRHNQATAIKLVL